MDRSPVRESQTQRAVVAASLLFPSFVTLVYFVLLADRPAAVQQTSYAIGKLIQFGFPVAWVFVVRRRRPSWTAPRPAGLAAGVAFGLLVLAAMLAIYHGYLKPAGLFTHAGDAIRQKVVGFGISDLTRYIALGVFYAAAHSFLEEYYWRWFVFGQLRELVSLPAAVAVSSAGFMAHHVILLATYFGWLSWATWAFSLGVACGGAVWAWLYHRYGSLFGPWLSHLLVDAAIFVIGYDLVRELFVG